MSDSNFLLKRIGTYDLSGVRLGKGNFAYVELATNRVAQTKVCLGQKLLIVMWYTHCFL